jgi:hypothetical protein
VQQGHVSVYAKNVDLISPRQQYKYMETFGRAYLKMQAVQIYVNVFGATEIYLPYGHLFTNADFIVWNLRPSQRN